MSPFRGLERNEKETNKNSVGWPKEKVTNI